MPSLNVYRTNNNPSRIKTINAFRTNGNHSRIKTVNAFRTNGNYACVYRDVPDFLFKTNDKCTDYTGDWGSWDAAHIWDGKVSDWPSAGNLGSMSWVNGNMRLSHYVSGGFGGKFTRTGWAIDLEPYSWIAFYATLYAAHWGYQEDKWDNSQTYADFYAGLLPPNFGLGTVPTLLAYSQEISTRWYPELSTTVAAKNISVALDVRNITGFYHVFAGIYRRVPAVYDADIYQVRTS